MNSKSEALQRAHAYAAKHGLVIGNELGEGANGVVCVALSQNPKGGQSAVKACERESVYLRERDVYLRLQAKGISSLRQCEIPKLLGYDADLWIIEMTIVTRPFCLDFGGAYLDQPPDFTEEVMADWRAEKLDQFGKHWPEVQQIIAILETHGIYLMDVHPRNISFLD